MRTARATEAHAEKARAATHCQRGHSDWVRVRNGRRRCRVCALDRNAAYRMHWNTPELAGRERDIRAEPLRGAAGVRHPD